LSEGVRNKEVMRRIYGAFSIETHEYVQQYYYERQLGMKLWAKFALIVINVIYNFRRVIPVLITTAVFVSVVVYHPFS
jgi:diacylglycerol kinase